MGKRGKKLDENAEAEIIRLSKDYSPRRIAELLGLHINTVRKALERPMEGKVMATPSFHKHSNEMSNILKYIASNKELLDSSLVHFKQIFPQFVHLNTWQDINEEDIRKGIWAKIELLAESRTYRFCKRCPVCQAIERQLRKVA